jgi:hypothetical protein
MSKYIYIYMNCKLFFFGVNPSSVCSLIILIQTLMLERQLNELRKRKRIQTDSEAQTSASYTMGTWESGGGGGEFLPENKAFEA